MVQWAKRATVATRSAPILLIALSKGQKKLARRRAGRDAKEHHYQEHIRPARGKGPVQKSKEKYPPRRWVVERTFSWLSKCRGLLVRYEKKSRNYLGLLQFACALYWYRRLRTATADSA